MAYSQFRLNQHHSLVDTIAQSNAAMFTQGLLARTGSYVSTVTASGKTFLNNYSPQQQKTT